jgi:hypothetical protein
LYISIYGFQNLSKLSSFVSMASFYFLCKKIHSTKHFTKYNESIFIWCGLWCKIFGISKVQYVMVTQNIFMKFIQCGHITCYIYIYIYIYIYLSHFHILFIYILFHGSWLIIQQVVTRLCTPLCAFTLRRASLNKKGGMNLEWRVIDKRKSL